jgi:hypothetical protein
MATTEQTEAAIMINVPNDPFDPPQWRCGSMSRDTDSIIRIAFYFDRPQPIWVHNIKDAHE